MRSIWNGQVEFGLVSIPVRLYAATENNSVRFRQVHAQDGGQIRYQRVCSEDGEEVPYSEIAKGYQTEGGELVVITPDELAAAEPQSSRSAQVVEFVPLESIDPVYYDKTYYLEPRKSAVRPYLLLRDVLHKSDRVAIVRITLRNREAMAVLRAASDVIMLSTMHWADEVRTPAFPFLQEEHPQVRSEEMSMAMTLVDHMADDVFDPTEYHDRYRDAVAELVEGKLVGGRTQASGGTRRRSRSGKGSGEDEDVSDLLRALSASVDDDSGSRSTSGTKNTKNTKKSDTRKKPPAAKKSATTSSGRKAAAKKTANSKPRTKKGA
ncbi:Ku protein [Tomitella cavernea]|uniref:Non-homologous end joining protein Ku n=1 Tax=Tomitella cavernea TaxID=1387982 RepID=A0ABP9CIF0_9ACTN|nr:Ku protein [Tomitella cavernea]